MDQIVLHVDKMNDLTIVEVHGALTKENIIQTIGEFYGKQPTPSLLWDFSKATTIDLNLEDLQSIAENIKGLMMHRTHGRTAFVKSKVVNSGLGELFKAYAGFSNLPYEYKIFCNQQDALDWLNEIVY